jgi:hypothetical protein
MKEKRGGGRNEIMSVGPAVGLGHGAWMQRTPAIERARHHHPERGERPLLLTRATPWVTGRGPSERRGPCVSVWYTRRPPAGRVRRVGPAVKWSVAAGGETPPTPVPNSAGPTAEK